MNGTAMGREQHEKRNSERYDYPLQIEYRTGSNHSTEIRKGVLIDISRQGLAMYGFAPLPEGGEIVITSRLPVDLRRAMLRWIRQESEGMYRLGLVFLAG